MIIRNEFPYEGAAVYTPANYTLHTKLMSAISSFLWYARCMYVYVYTYICTYICCGTYIHIVVIINEFPHAGAVYVPTNSTLLTKRVPDTCIYIYIYKNTHTYI